MPILTRSGPTITLLQWKMRRPTPRSGDFLQYLIKHELIALGGQELLDQAHDAGPR